MSECPENHCEVWTMVYYDPVANNAHISSETSPLKIWALMDNTSYIKWNSYDRKYPKIYNGL